MIKREINITGYTPVKNILCVGCLCPGLGQGLIRRVFNPMSFASGLNILFRTASLMQWVDDRG